MKEQEEYKEICQYIKKSSGKRKGLIKGIKLVSETGPIVVITHSCCNLKHENFDSKKAHQICEERAKYCLNVIDHYESKRQKEIEQKPNRMLKKYYSDMFDRCTKYFKDINKNNIFSYYNFFEYV